MQIEKLVKECGFSEIHAASIVTRLQDSIYSVLVDGAKATSYSKSGFTILGLTLAEYMIVDRLEGNKDDLNDQVVYVGKKIYSEVLETITKPEHDVQRNYLILSIEKDAERHGIKIK